MKHITLADNLKLPLDAITQKIAILGRTGSGKTVAAKLLFEQFLKANHPGVWIDPIGVAWGLRQKFGVAIAGGLKQDIPLAPTAGKIMADFLVKNRLPMILDLSEFSDGQAVGFVADFCQRFYDANRKPFHIFLDEADEFAPQVGYKAAGGDIPRCIGAVKRIVNRGRARGIGSTLICQRSAHLAKSVLSASDPLIAMQTTAPRDLAAIEEWLEYHATKDQLKEIMETIPKLQPGEAWFYSPGWAQSLVRVKFHMIESFDSSRTPKPGEAKSEPKTLAQVDLGKLKAEMTATIERAKADDPAELKKKIAELTSQLNAKGAPAKPVVDQAAIARAVKAATTDRDRLIAKMQTAIKRALELLGNSNLYVLFTTDETKTAVGETPAAKKTKLASQTTVLATNRVPNGLGRCERALLTALAQSGTVDKPRLSILSGYSSKSSSFQNALAALRTARYASGYDVITITDDGLSALGDFQPLPTGDALQRYWIGKLGKCEGAILQSLINIFPNSMTKSQIGGASGYSTTSSSFQNSLSKLRTLKLIDGYDAITASKDFF